MPRGNLSSLRLLFTGNRLSGFANFLQIALGPCALISLEFGWVLHPTRAPLLFARKVDEHPDNDPCCSIESQLIGGQRSVGDLSFVIVAYVSAWTSTFQWPIVCRCKWVGARYEGTLCRVGLMLFVQIVFAQRKGFRSSVANCFLVVIFYANNWHRFGHNISGWIFVAVLKVILSLKFMFRSYSTFWSPTHLLLICVFLLTNFFPFNDAVLWLPTEPSRQHKFGVH